MKDAVIIKENYGHSLDRLQVLVTGSFTCYKHICIVAYDSIVQGCFYVSQKNIP